MFIWRQWCWFFLWCAELWSCFPSEHPGKQNICHWNQTWEASPDLTQNVAVRVNAEPEAGLGVSGGAGVAGRVGQEPAKVRVRQEPDGARVVRAVRDHGLDDVIDGCSKSSWFLFWRTFHSFCIGHMCVECWFFCACAEIRQRCKRLWLVESSGDWSRPRRNNNTLSPALLPFIICCHLIINNFLSQKEKAQPSWNFDISSPIWIHSIWSLDKVS